MITECFFPPKTDIKAAFLNVGFDFTAQSPDDQIVCLEQLRLVNKNIKDCCPTLQKRMEIDCFSIMARDEDVGRETVP